MVDENGRECLACHEYKTWDRFSEMKNGINGKWARCKDCINKDSKEKRDRAAALRPKARVDDEGRECTTCGEFKLWSNYGKDKHNKTGKCSSCKACKVAAHSRWKTENPEKKKAAEAAWVANNLEYVRERAKRSSAEHRDTLGSSEYAKEQKEWRLANPGKHAANTKRNYAAHREEFKAKTKLDRANRPEAYAAYDATKRAKRVKGFCPWADQAAIQAIYKLAKALSKASGLKYHVDHIVPLVSKKVQGLHVESNLRITCASDNLLKSNKFDPDTFDPNDIPSVHWADMSEADPDDLHGKVTALIERAMSNQTPLPQIEEVKSPATT